MNANAIQINPNRQTNNDMLSLYTPHLCVSLELSEVEVRDDDDDEDAINQ